LPPAREPKKGRHSGNAGLFGPRYEQEADEMKRDLRVLATASALLLSMGTASAQKQGGILKIGHFDSPASMSMIEESTLATNRPMMGVFNNPTREGRPALLHQFSLAVHLDDLKSEGYGIYRKSPRVHRPFPCQSIDCVPRDQPKRSF
jgi:hypothetical protein